MDPELEAALAAVHLTEADVTTWRIEGYTVVVLATDGRKYRVPTRAHAARVAAVATEARPEEART